VRSEGAEEVEEVEEVEAAVPARIRDAVAPREPRAKADASRSQASALSATGIVLAPDD
jgi:hypothetical protein